MRLLRYQKVYREFIRFALGYCILLEIIIIQLDIFMLFTLFEL
jgi:hypothetical protein